MGYFDVNPNINAVHNVSGNKFVRKGKNLDYISYGDTMLHFTLEEFPPQRGFSAGLYMWVTQKFVFGYFDISSTFHGSVPKHEPKEKLIDEHLEDFGNISLAGKMIDMSLDDSNHFYMWNDYYYHKDLPETTYAELEAPIYKCKCTSSGIEYFVQSAANNNHCVKGTAIKEITNTANHRGINMNVTCGELKLWLWKVELLANGEDWKFRAHMSGKWPMNPLFTDTVEADMIIYKADWTWHLIIQQRNFDNIPEKISSHSVGGKQVNSIRGTLERRKEYMVFKAQTVCGDNTKPETCAPYLWMYSTDLVPLQFNLPIDSLFPSAKNENVRIDVSDNLVSDVGGFVKCPDGSGHYVQSTIENWDEPFCEDCELVNMQKPIDFEKDVKPWINSDCISKYYMGSTNERTKSMCWDIKADQTTCNYPPVEDYWISDPISYEGASLNSSNNTISYNQSNFKNKGINGGKEIIISFRSMNYINPIGAPKHIICLQGRVMTPVNGYEYTDGTSFNSCINHYTGFRLNHNQLLRSNQIVDGQHIYELGFGWYVPDVSFKGDANNTKIHFVITYENIEYYILHNMIPIPNKNNVETSLYIKRHNQMLIGWTHNIDAVKLRSHLFWCY